MGLKAQAAMEYLVNYGWALLALFLVVAFLISSGAFSSSSFSAQECIFQPSLPCPSFIIYRQGSSNPAARLEFALVNGLGFPINISNVSYETSNLGQEGKKVWVGPLPSQPFLQPGARANFSMDFPGASQPSFRQFRTIHVSVSYYSCKTLPCTGPYTTSGRISSIVEEKP
ncbi:MAG: hypothetical protein N3F07_03630 [Candidatus Micrarchaeota archaeon]|nr:hypothetical protein [Candidatus Micrarchaeota archaeon]